MGTFDLTRRQLLGTGATLGVTAGVVGAAGVLSSDPGLEKFVQPLPIPRDAEPADTRDGVDYYELTMTEHEHQFHPDLPSTTVWGFEGATPSPVIRADRGERIKVSYDNSQLPSSHRLAIDDRIPGTQPADYDEHDGPVPDVR